MGILTESRHTTAFIVRRLAVYESYDEIIDAVKEEFGIELAPSDIGPLNPENKGCILAKDMRELYDEVRDRFQSGLDDVAIVWRPYRMKRLDEMERMARRKGRFSIARDMLEQAAREMGGFYDKHSGISLSALQAQIDKLATAVADEVADPDVIARIEQRWAE